MARRLLLLVVALALWSTCAQAAIAVVQPTSGLPVAATQCTSAATCAYTMPSQPTGANALIVAVSFGSFGSQAITVTDTGLNSYSSTTAQSTSINACTAGAIGSCIQIFYTTNLTTAASFVVTAHATTNTAMTVFAAEYSGVQTATPVDKQRQDFGTSTTPAVATQTATTANSLYVAALVHDGSGTVTITGGGSFTERAEAENTANQTQGQEDIISSAAQTGPFTLGASAAWGETMVIFIPASGVVAPPTRTLLGVGKAAP